MTLDGRLLVGGPRKPLAEGGIWKPTLQTTVAQEWHSAYLAALFTSPTALPLICTTSLFQMRWDVLVAV